MRMSRACLRASAVAAGGDASPKEAGAAGQSPFGALSHWRVRGVGVARVSQVIWTALSEE
jgi:hypothetical protein